MTSLNPTIVSELVALANGGATPAQIMHVLADRLPSSHRHTPNLIHYMRTAFGLSLAQASPIAGWAPNGSGELPDARLNDLLTQDIQANRGRWAR